MMRLRFVVCFFLLNAATCATQSSYQGFTPGTSTRAEVEKSLGRPTRTAGRVSTYHAPPASELSSISVQYTAGSNIVERIEVYFPGPVDRSALIRTLGLPQEPETTKVASGKLVEYFGSPQWLALTYAAAKQTDGVSSVAYYTPGLFNSVLGKPPVRVVAPPGASNGTASGAQMPGPTAASTAGDLSSVLRPLEANKAHIFTLKLLTPISSVINKAGDPIQAQVVSSDPAQGSIVTGTIRGFNCTSAGVLKCVLDFSLDTLTYNGRTIPVVGNLTALTNSKGWPHVDEEGSVVTQGGNYTEAISKPLIAASINGTRMGPHQDVFIELTANGSTLSFAAGTQFSAALNSDLGPLQK